MNHLSITRKRSWLQLLIAIALAAGLALSMGPMPKVRAATGMTMFALTTSNTLLRFDSAAPSTILGTVAVSGLQAGEELLGIDFRPATGQLYGLGSTSRLYMIDLG